MKHWKRIAVAMSMMFMVSLFTGIGVITALAGIIRAGYSARFVEADVKRSLRAHTADSEDAGGDGEEAAGKTNLTVPERAWWSDATTAVWKGVRGAKQYQVKLYETAGLETAILTVKVSSMSYDFSEAMEDGKQYYFMVRAIPKVNEQQLKAASPWQTSEDGGTVLLGETGGTWRSYLDGRQYEKADGTLAAGWLMIQGSWYLFNEAGYVITDTWVDWDSGRYYLNADGAAITGWMEWEEAWYCFDRNGRMLTGWVNGELPTQHYYLNPDGRMAHNTVVDGVVIDSDGLAVNEKEE